MAKLNQTEIKSLARQIASRVNDEVSKHNESLKTSKEYAKFKKDFPETNEGKDVAETVKLIKKDREAISKLWENIDKKKKYLEDKYHFVFTTKGQYGGTRTEDENKAMELAITSAQKGKFKEKRMLDYNMHSSYISEDMMKLIDKLTINQVEGSQLKDTMDDLVKELLSKL